MAVNEILSETNLRLNDIRDTMNANGGSVDDDAVNFFSSSANINMWARYKPIPYDADFTDMTFYKRSNCGISVTSVNHPSLLADVLNGGLNGWKYNLPRGKSYGEPFRIGDFRKYSPKAGKPFDEYVVPSDALKDTSGLTVMMVVAQDSTDDRTYLIPSDFETIGSCYFGAYITGSGANFVKTAANTVGAGFATVTFDTTGLVTGYTYTVYPFLCTSAITTQTTTVPTGIYYSIPYTSVKTFTVKSGTLAVDIIGGELAQRTDGSNMGDYFFTIQRGSSGTAITDAYVTIRSSEGVIVAQQALGSIGTVASDGTFTYRGFISIPQSIIYAGAGVFEVTCKHGNVGLSYQNDIAFDQSQKIIYYKENLK